MKAILAESRNVIVTLGRQVDVHFASDLLVIGSAWAEELVMTEDVIFEREKEHRLKVAALEWTHEQVYLVF